MHKNIAASFQKIKYIFKKNYVNWFFYHNWFRLLVTFFLLAVLCVCLIEVFTEVWCLVETNILDSIGPLIQWYYNNRPDWLHAFFLSMWAIAQPILTGVVFCLHKVYGWLETIVETIIYCISPLFRESITDNFQFETAEMIISTVGISGFALNTINELKTKRSHGIALETVINHYYPCYHMFFLPHIAFFFSGMYACKISNERCALLCIIGILVGAAYSFCITWRVSLEKAKRSALASCYIRKFTQWYWLKQFLPLYSAATINTLISDTALYIGEEYHNRSSQHPAKLMHWLEQDLDVLTKLIHLQRIKENRNIKRKTQYLNGSFLGLAQGNEWMLKKLFSEIFLLTEDNWADNGDIGRYVIYRVPYISDHLINKKLVNTGVAFENRIRGTEHIWRNVFRPVEDDERGKAEITSVILTDAFLRDYVTFLTLVCGLISYLHNTGSDPIQNCKKRVIFLQLVRKYSKSIHIEHSSLTTIEMNKWQPYQSALGLIELGVNLWENALCGATPQDDADWVTNTLLAIADSQHVIYNIHYEPEELASIYLAISYLVYNTTVISQDASVSRAGLNMLVWKLETEMSKQIRHMAGNAD